MKKIVLLMVVLTTNCIAQPFVNWSNNNDVENFVQPIGEDIVLKDSFIYVAGSCNGVNPFYNFIIVRLNNFGDTIWTKKLLNNVHVGTVNGGGDQMITCDELGNVYVCFTEVNTGFDIVVVKINKIGEIIWFTTFDSGGMDQANSLSLDNSGGVIVTGSGDFEGTNIDCLTIKYDTNGNELWHSIFDSGNTSWDDEGLEIKVSENDNIYVAGFFGLLKYDINGQLLWSDVNLTFAQANESSVHVIIDSDLNVFYTSPIGNIIKKYDTQGNLLYNSTFVAADYISNDLRFIAHDSENNIITTGWCKKPNNNYDIVVQKLNSNLNLIWQKEYFNNNEYPNDLAVDNNDNIHVLGRKYLLLNYSSNGELIWDSIFLVNENPVCRELYLDLNNNIYVTGSIGIKILTVKLSENYIANSKELSEDIKMQLSPNPTTGKVKIVFPFNNSKILIQNYLSQIIYDETMHSGKKMEINVEKSGVYFVSIIEENKRWIEKVVVE
ncbi:MAG: hypothetical protein HYU67_06600 [Flavobacteriia bacterium]|nr:hypothetical protein [Flavobacteriia bacterium]